MSKKLVTICLLALMFITLVTKEAMAKETSSGSLYNNIVKSSSLQKMDLENRKEKLNKAIMLLNKDKRLLGFSHKNKESTDVDDVFFRGLDRFTKGIYHGSSFKIGMFMNPNNFLCIFIYNKDMALYSEWTTLDQVIKFKYFHFRDSDVIKHVLELPEPDKFQKFYEDLLITFYDQYREIPVSDERLEEGYKTKLMESVRLLRERKILLDIPPVIEQNIFMSSQFFNGIKKYMIPFYFEDNKYFALMCVDKKSYECIYFYGKNLALSSQWNALDEMTFCYHAYWIKSEVTNPIWGKVPYAYKLQELYEDLLIAFYEQYSDKRTEEEKAADKKLEEKKQEKLNDVVWMLSKKKIRKKDNSCYEDRDLFDALRESGKVVRFDGIDYHVAMLETCQDFYSLFFYSHDLTICSGWDRTMNKMTKGVLVYFYEISTSNLISELPLPRKYEKLYEDLLMTFHDKYIGDSIN